MAIDSHDDHESSHFKHVLPEMYYFSGHSVSEVHSPLMSSLEVIQDSQEEMVNPLQLKHEELHYRHSEALL